MGHLSSAIGLHLDFSTFILITTSCPKLKNIPAF